MKALTVKHPWAWAIIDGGKDVENRSRRTSYRGRILIHAGKAMDFDAFTFPAFERAANEYGTRGVGPFEKINEIDLSTCGMVLGAIDLIDCHHADDCRDTVGFCSAWAMEHSYHWVLANPLPFETPFPAKGMLGIWNLKVPA